MGSIGSALAMCLALALVLSGCGGGGSGVGSVGGDGRGLAGDPLPGGSPLPDDSLPGETPPPDDDPASGDEPTPGDDPTPGETPAPGDADPVGTPPGGSLTFKVVHWNVQSGFGKAGWDGGTGFTPGSNCATNAWGNGNGPLARTLVEKVRNDASVVALTLNEAWTCATPARIKDLVGFAATAPDWGPGDVGGVSIVARYGFAGKPEVTPLPKCSSDSEPRNVVRAPVYADAGRRTVVQVFATHWTGCDAEGPATRAIMAPYADVPTSFAGDLNAKSSEASVAALRQGGYADAWTTVNGDASAPTATWNNANGTPPGNLYKRIDYVFFRGLSVRSASRFNHDGTPGTHKMADHAGLIVEYAR